MEMITLSHTDILLPRAPRYLLALSAPALRLAVLTGRQPAALHWEGGDAAGTVQVQLGQIFWVQVTHPIARGSC